MTDESSKDFAQRALPRIPLKLRVNMEFEKFSGFISEYSENVSEGGMFIKTATPRQMGSVFAIEFKLKDDYKLIQGWGEVVWVREKTETPDKPAGMGIRFLDIDQSSKELIRNIISIHKKDPGDEKVNPFEFMNLPSDKEGTPPETKHGEADLSSLTKEVFGEKAKHGPKDNLEVVDDIFKDLNTEMAQDKQPQKPPAKPLASIPLKSQTTHEPSDESDFVKEVFGKDKTEKELSPETGSQRAIPKIKVDENDSYKKVSWYLDPSSVIVIVIIILVIATGFFYHDKVTRTAWLIRGYLIDKDFVPFKDTKIMQAIFKTPLNTLPRAPLKQLVVSQAPKAPTVTAPADTASPSATPPIVPTAAQTISPTVSKPEAKPPKPAISELLLANVATKKGKNGEMTVNFSLNGAAPENSITNEFLESPPRYLVKIMGINKPYKRLEITLAHPQLKKIRMAVHENPTSLYIVFDLSKSVTKNMISFNKAGNGFSVSVASK